MVIQVFNKKCEVGGHVKGVGEPSERAPNSKAGTVGATKGSIIVL